MSMEQQWVMTKDGERVGLALREDSKDQEHLVRILIATPERKPPTWKPFVKRSSQPGVDGCTWIPTAQLQTELSAAAEALKEKLLADDAASEERRAARYATAVASPKPIPLKDIYPQPIPMQDSRFPHHHHTWG